MTRQPDDFAAQAVLMRLGRGIDHAVTLHALADQFGSAWTTRDVKRAVNALRHDGFLIASGNEGYWLAEPADVQRWLRRQRSQIFAMFATYRKVRRAAAAHGYHQETLGFDEAA